MERRAFLIQGARAGAVLLILPAGGAVPGCGTDSVKGNLEGPTTSATSGLLFTTDITGEHRHDFTIPADDLEHPPSGGLTGPTTTSLGHYHIVFLSQTDLARIQGGDTIFKVTSIVDGHLHNLNFSLATATKPASTTETGDASTSASDGGS